MQNLTTLASAVPGTLLGPQNLQWVTWPYSHVPFKGDLSPKCGTWYSLPVYKIWRL